MERHEILQLAEAYTEEYKSLLYVDPYLKISVELADFDGTSECTESEQPATWMLKLNPSRHMDEIDVQMSAINGVLIVLFRDIQPSKRRDEVISKITHTLVSISVPEEPEEQAD